MTIGEKKEEREVKSEENQKETTTFCRKSSFLLVRTMGLEPIRARHTRSLVLLVCQFRHARVSSVVLDYYTTQYSVCQYFYL